MSKTEHATERPWFRLFYKLERRLVPPPETRRYFRTRKGLAEAGVVGVVAKVRPVWTFAGGSWDRFYLYHRYAPPPVGTYCLS